MFAFGELFVSLFMTLGAYMFVRHLSQFVVIGGFVFFPVTGGTCDVVLRMQADGPVLHLAGRDLSVTLNAIVPGQYGAGHERNADDSSQYY